MRVLRLALIYAPTFQALGAGGAAHIRGGSPSRSQQRASRPPHLGRWEGSGAALRCCRRGAPCFCRPGAVLVVCRDLGFRHPALAFRAAPRSWLLSPPRPLASSTPSLWGAVLSSPLLLLPSACGRPPCPGPSLPLSPVTSAVIPRLGLLPCVGHSRRCVSGLVMGWSSATPPSLRPTLSPGLLQRGVLIVPHASSPAPPGWLLRAAPHPRAPPGLAPAASQPLLYLSFSALACSCWKGQHRG